MRVKLYNKVTGETQIVESISYTDHSITEQAGRGIMVTNYDDNWEITEYNEETDNDSSN